jgi:hypothetical protein
MHRRTNALRAGLVGATAVILVATTQAPAVQAARSTDTAAPRIDVPGQPWIYGMKALSPTDVWAVGNLPGGFPYAGHWNGSHWKRSRLPFLQGKQMGLSAVDASAPDDVWAVGPKYSGAFALAMHYDGSRWRRTPIVQEDPVTLSDVAVVSRDDVWVVGELGTSGYQPFTEHWDGDSWSVVDVSSPLDYAILTSVAAVTSNDVWAVGQTYGAVHGRHSLIVHWDGTEWQQVASPSPMRLYAVAAVSGNDVWAAGAGRHYALHWDGSSWQQVDIPGRLHMTIYDISARAADDVWMAGLYQSSVEPRQFSNLMLHWDGQSWTEADVPGGHQEVEGLSAVSADAADDAWTAGYGPERHYVRHWDGTSWS